MTKIIRYGFIYGLWLISMVAAAVIGLLTRDVVSSALAVMAADATEKSRSAQFYVGLRLRAAEPWTFLLFGVIMIGVIVFVEYFYRTGAYQNRLLSRFFLFSAIEAGVLTLAHALRLGVSVHLGGSIWPGLLLPLVEPT